MRLTTITLPQEEWFTESNRRECERYVRQIIAEQSGVHFSEVLLLDAASVYRQYKWVPVEDIGWGRRGGLETVVRWRVCKHPILESSIVGQVESEYQESFVEVLRGFRVQGVSWRLIADTLDIPLNTLRKWVKELGLSDGRRSTDTYIPPGLNEKAREFGYRNAEQMISDLRSAGKTRKDIAELLKCHPDSLYRYTNEEAKEIVNITPSMIAARRKSVKKALAAYVARNQGR